MLPTVGFIGLGLMGKPMAKNILKKGFSLTVYNRTPGKTNELQDLGATVATTPAELATTCDIIITMVTAGKDVEALLFAKNGIVAGGKNLIVVDMSTIGVISATTIAKRLSKYNIEFIDAPVTGSTPGAISGELTIFIGGKKETYEKVKPVLSAMGTNLQYVGESGYGQAVKLINNLLVASTITSLAEAMILSDAMQVDRRVTARALENVPALSAFMKLKLPNFLADKFPLFFSTNNMKKDLSLALLEAKKGKKTLPVLQKVEKLYEKAQKQRLGEEDMSSIIKTLLTL